MNLHSAGATVRHASVFNHLETYRNDFQLSQEFIDKWALPLYMKIRHIGDNSWIDYLKQIKDEITEEVTLALLGDFNWRTRTVGAYLSALKNYENQIDIIGIHLLKSEVCYAGDLYALIFAFYNKPKTIEYLNQYLEYYLQKPELYFDQESVLEAIAYLDTVNNTNNLSKHLNQWNKMLESRGEISKIRNIQIAQIIEEQEGKDNAQKYLSSLNQVIINPELNIKNISEQIQLLHELKNYFA
ncbi:hypothetical protein J3D55_001529 [Chryseobacterium ginsenosidimutans]|uniref:DUF6000 family protein n=1 Tax=Chryseobacterium ginsenosidimutans TaxID=687846 RepID=UPI002168658F|nr:DUF6000 family protein [Chryseobacterium ginsenosidimutans]MCS3868613.1 hypothetical protein [Chryseobacterium ginsenosidimutans]